MLRKQKTRIKEHSKAVQPILCTERYVYTMDNFFKAMKDSDWGESVTDLDFRRNTSEILNDCERAVRDEPELEYDMVVRKSWAEYAKEINRMRAQLRYMKKSVGYGRGQCIYENQRDILEMEKEIKRLCKLRDCAKAMEKGNRGVENVCRLH